MLRSWMNTAGRNRLDLSILAAMVLWLSSSAVAQLPSAQETVDRQVPESWRGDADLHDIVFVDNEYGWAVGDHGTIWHTQNGGEIWRPQESRVTCQLRTVHFVDRQRGWAAGGMTIPLTSMSRAVLLNTEDGGKTWQQTEGLLLPWVNGIHFSDHKHGIAIGHASSVYPAGAWVTTDGGRTWSPLPGVRGTHWVQHDLQVVDGRSSGLLRGHDGQIARLSNNRLTTVFQPRKAWSRDSLLAFVNSEVYFASTPSPSLTKDGGRTWRDINAITPNGIKNQMQFRTMVFRGNHGWLAGSPGNRILHSADHGQTWQAKIAPSTLPLERLHFTSERDGWAVGARGTILATHDGGQTWKRQRAGMKRDALLGIFADERDIPWQLLAQSSAVDELRTHIVLVTTAGDATRSLIAQRVQDAAMNIGASAEVLTHAEADAEVDHAVDSLIRRWEQQQPDAIDWLAKNLTRIVRERRPEVVLASERSPGRSGQGTQRLVRQLVSDACEYAASDQAFVDHLQQLGLGVWSVSRAVVCVAHPSRSKAIPAARTTANGDTADDLAVASRRILGQPDHDADWTLQSLNRDDRGTDVGRQLFAGIVVEYDSAARRTRAMSNAVSSNRNLALALSRMSNQGLQRVEQIETLAGNADQAGQVLFDLALQELDPAERNTLLGQFITRHEDHPLVESALLQLVDRHSSLERQWWEFAAKRTTPSATVLAEVPQDDDAGSGSTVQLVSAESDAFQPNWQTALVLFDRIRSKRPMLYAEPEIAFPLAAIQRLDQPDGANALLQQQQRSFLAWQHHANTELKLAGAGSKDQLTTWPCEFSSTRPLLDGDLGDEIWRSAEFQRLAVVDAVPSQTLSPTLIGIAKDEEYLYFAAYCPKRRGVQYDPIRKKRPRDAHLEAHDRVQLNLDINRDYQSWWSLTFDNRGWTIDALNEDQNWNPKYYVASKSDAQVWSIEAAIPLDELAPITFQSNYYWAIGVERIVPGLQRERWNASHSEKNPPFLQGIMHLE